MKFKLSRKKTAIIFLVALTAICIPVFANYRAEYVLATILNAIKITDGEHDVSIDHGGGIVSIEHEHYRIHEGDHYFTTHSPTLASGAEIEYIIYTGNNGIEAHMFFATSTSGQAEIQLYENVTIDANGTALDSWNNLRTSTKNATVTIYHTPTNVAGGTDLLNGGVVIGLGRNVAGLSRNSNELVLKPETIYCLTVTNQVAGQSNIVIQLFDWYEEQE